MTVTVSKKALYELLITLNSGSIAVNELLAIKGLDDDCPITTLINEYNAQNKEKKVCAVEEEVERQLELIDAHMRENNLTDANLSLSGRYGEVLAKTYLRLLAKGCKVDMHIPSHMKISNYPLGQEK